MCYLLTSGWHAFVVITAILRCFLPGAGKKPETNFTPHFRPAFILLRMSISISPMFYRVQKMSFKKHAKLQIIPRWILVNFIGLPWPLNFIHWRMIEVKLLAKTSTAMLKAGNGSFYNANSKGRILWEGTNHVFLGCLSGHFGLWRLLYFMKV